MFRIFNLSHKFLIICLRLNISPSTILLTKPDPLPASSKTFIQIISNSLPLQQPWTLDHYRAVVLDNDPPPLHLLLSIQELSSQLWISSQLLL